MRQFAVAIILLAGAAAFSQLCFSPPVRPAPLALESSTMKAPQQIRRLPLEIIDIKGFRCEGRFSEIETVDNWDLSIDAAGLITHFYPGSSVKEKKHISQEDLLRLAGIIEKNDFFSLTEKIDYGLQRSCHPQIFTLSISLRGQERTVKARDILLNPGPEFDRFSEVWANFLQLAKGENASNLLSRRLSLIEMNK
jgi:hypothetical protein